MNVGDLDLLSSHDLTATRNIANSFEGGDENKVLIWHKLNSSGYRPAAREVFSDSIICYQWVKGWL